jgi:hypothetical protein
MRAMNPGSEVGPAPSVPFALVTALRVTTITRHTTETWATIRVGTALPLRRR